jgi:hypothetical protein
MPQRYFGSFRQGRTLSIKISRVLVTTIGMSLAGALFSSVPADAASLPPLGKTTWSKPYSVGYCFNSASLKRGLSVRLHGKVRYYRRVFMVNLGKGGSIREIDFGDPTLLNPVMEVKTVTKCKGGKAAGVSRTSMNQLWYDWKCKTSVSVFTGLPWQVGVGATRSCGRTKVANRATSYGKGSHFTQQNSGAPVGWDWEKRIGQGGKICLHADGGVTAYIGNTSDTVIKPLDVCVAASYKAKP